MRANVKEKWIKSAAPVDNSAASKIIWRDLDLHSIAWNDTDEILSHAACDMRNHFVSVVQFDAKLRVGQCFLHSSFDFDCFFFGHEFPRRMNTRRSATQPHGLAEFA